MKAASPPLLVLSALAIPACVSFLDLSGILVGACQGPGDPYWLGALMKAVARFLTEMLKALKKKKAI